MAACAAVSGVYPLSTDCIKRSRASGGRRAFLWMLIRSSEDSLKLLNSGFLARDRMDNLSKAHIQNAKKGPYPRTLFR